MNKWKIFEGIWISILIIGAFILIGMSIYNEFNMEYMYTASVPCYDKHDSMIEGLECKHDVVCGPWQDITSFRDRNLPCEEGGEK